MRLALTMAALALSTTGALAQIGPAGPFEFPADDPGRFEREDREPDWGGLSDEDDEELRFERIQRRGFDEDFGDDRDFRREGRDWDRRDWDRDWRDRDWRDRDWDRRGPYRGPVITFGAPGYFVRTLPEVVRVVRYRGLPCRVTITRRVTYRGNIVVTERRRCPGRPDFIIQRR